MAGISRHTLLGKPYRFAVVSDLDWTMVNHADVVHQDLLRFNRLWLSEFAADSLLVFSTGRSPELFKELAAEVPLLTPDILVCSVGTEILINGQPDQEWEAHLNRGWDRDKAAAIAAGLPHLEQQRASEQRPHKISYKLHAPTPQQAASTLESLRAQLQEAGLETNVVYSAGIDVDILPSRASKGKALAFLLQQLDKYGGRPKQGVLVCGDSGNDVELFAVEGVYGCMVANAHAELREWCEAHASDTLFKATANGPGGICQAIQHFGFANAQLAQQAGSRRVRETLLSLSQHMEQWVGAAVPRNSPDALPAFLDAFLAPGFEHVTVDGAVMRREEYLQWWSGSRYGCQADQRASAPDPRTQPANDAPTTEQDGAEAPAAGTGGGLHGFRVWLDRMNVWEVAPGVWAARYVELHQPFTAGAHTHEQRSARCASMVLTVGGEDGEERMCAVMSHETRVPLGSYHDL